MASIKAWPNGLRFSRAASIDREYGWDNPSFQNASDLRAAKRRRLQALVSRQQYCHGISMRNISF
jgi:hypothetical protein